MGWRNGFDDGGWWGVGMFGRWKDQRGWGWGGLVKRCVREDLDWCLLDDGGFFGGCYAVVGFVEGLDWFVWGFDEVGFEDFDDNVREDVGFGRRSMFGSNLNDIGTLLGR
ncbi:hypothetical protein [Candidatus Hodgkinia cicadicola]|uniref:hypothetical protein n=1 Tax=Candidatus Hodgkinia cicadicola TaxID=573658 RepID=UPI0011BA93F4